MIAAWCSFVFLYIKPGSSIYICQRNRLLENDKIPHTPDTEETKGILTYDDLGPTIEGVLLSNSRYRTYAYDTLQDPAPSKLDTANEDGMLDVSDPDTDLRAGMYVCGTQYRSPIRYRSLGIGWCCPSRY